MSEIYMGAQERDIKGRSHRPKIEPQLEGVDAGQEMLGNGKVEVRFAESDRDFEGIGELFNQTSAIGHLSGLVPKGTSSKDIEKWTVQFHTLIIPANGKDIRDFYKRRPNLIPLVAEKSGKEIIGTATVEKPAGALGLTYTGVSRLVVDENEWGKGYAQNLLRSSNALIFTEIKLGGLGETVSQAGVINLESPDTVRFGVDRSGTLHTGDDLLEQMEKEQITFTMKVSQDVYKVLKVFNSRDYIPRRDINTGNCVSWDNKLRRPVRRDVIIVRKEITYRSTGRTRYFPKEAPKTTN